MATARQRRVAQRLADMASDEHIFYTVLTEFEVEKVGHTNWYPVRARRTSNGEEWDYFLAADYGSYQGSF
jgi:hypothetical protein